MSAGFPGLQLFDALVWKGRFLDTILENKHSCVFCIRMHNVCVYKYDYHVVQSQIKMSFESQFKFITVLWHSGKSITKIKSLNCFVSEKSFVAEQLQCN